MKIVADLLNNLQSKGNVEIKYYGVLFELSVSDNCQLRVLATCPGKSSISRVLYRINDISALIFQIVSCVQIMTDKQVEPGVVEFELNNQFEMV